MMFKEVLNFNRNCVRAIAIDKKSLLTIKVRKVFKLKVSDLKCNSWSTRKCSKYVIYLK